MHIFRKNKQQIADRHNYLQQSQQRLENTKKNEKTTSGLRVSWVETHNPEVVGSSPAPATIKHLISYEIRCFSALFALK